MSLFDWLFGKSGVRANDLANRVVEAAMVSSCTNLSSITTSRDVQHFACVADLSPDKLFLTVVAGALPLSTHVLRGQSEEFGKEFTGHLFKSLHHRFSLYEPGVVEMAWHDARRYLQDHESQGLKHEVIAGIWLTHQLKRAVLTAEEVRDGGMVGEALGILALQLFEGMQQIREKGTS